MALPTITFNSATGSNTQASGSGGTAIFGANAATVAANNVVTLSVDAPDLSGVAVDGSMTIYVDSSSGRKHSKITAVDNGLKTVTCQDNYANTEATRAWGIGGKRATLAGSTQFGLDCYEGWTASFEDDASMTLATSYTWTPTLSAADGRLNIKSSVVGTNRICNNTANNPNFTWTVAAHVDITDIKFTNSNATKTAANAHTSSASSQIHSINCVYGDSVNKLNSACTRSTASPMFAFSNCELTYLVTGSSASNNAATRFFGCWIHNGTSHGITNSQSGGTIYGCLITDNGGDGINCSLQQVIVICNTIHGNTGDGIDTTAGVPTIITVFNNNITGNGGYGWRASANTDNIINSLCGYNNFGTGATANTSGAMLNVSTQPGDLAVDPGYVATGSNNYAIGAAVKNKAFPVSTVTLGDGISGTLSFVDIGAAQSESTGGIFMLTE